MSSTTAAVGCMYTAAAAKPQIRSTSALMVAVATAAAAAAAAAA